MPKTGTKRSRNYALVILALLVIVFNVAVIIFSVLFFTTLGWWSLLTITGAVASIWLAVTAICKNDPAWLLLDLILPG